MPLSKYKNSKVCTHFVVTFIYKATLAKQNNNEENKNS